MSLTRPRSPFALIRLLAVLACGAPIALHAEEPGADEPKTDRSIRVRVHELQEVALGCAASRASVSGANTFDVKMVGGKLMVEGISPGKSTILVWCRSGERKSVLIEVVPRARVGAHRRMLHRSLRAGRDSNPRPPA